MKLTDILPLENWMELEREIHERSGLDVNVFNIDGFRISDYKQWVNRLCPAIKADDRGQSFICAVAHMNIAGMAKRSKRPAIVECDAGLLKMVVPIFVKGEFIGAVGACGVLLDDGEIDSFTINRTIDMDETEIEGLSNDIKSITSEEAEDLGKYITENLEKIAGDFENQKKE